MPRNRREAVGDWFDKVATAFGRWMSNPYTFLTVFVVILVWTVAGFFLGYMGSWISSMHMAGPVVTLLLVFLLQHGQAKNTRALQLKLDELIAAQKGARNSTIKAERRTSAEMEDMEQTGPHARRGSSNNLQVPPSGAQARSKGHANGAQRSQTRRDPGKRRRRAGAGPRPRSAELRSADR